MTKCEICGVNWSNYPDPYAGCLEKECPMEKRFIERVIQQIRDEGLERIRRHRENLIRSHTRED
jgi:hypothetical protein